MNNEKLAYSIREAVAATSIGRTTLFDHISHGRLRAVKVGGRTLIPAKELERFINGD